MEKYKGNYSKAWLVVLSAVFVGIAIATAQNKVLPCIDIIQEELGTSKSMAGWLSSVFSLTGICMAFPAAMIVRKIGYKTSCIVSAAFSGAGTLLGLLSNSVGWMFLSRVIEGIGAGLIAVTVPALISLWFPPEKRGVPTAVWSSWQYAGQAICFYAGARIMENASFKVLWIFGLAFLVIAVILSILFISVPKAPENEREQVQSAPHLSASLKNRNGWLASMGLFFFCLSSFGFVSWGASAWVERIGMEFPVANKYISLFAIIALPAVILVGYILDRVNQIRFSAACFMCYAIIVGVGFLLPSRLLVLPYVIVYAFSEASIPASLYTILPLTATSPEEIPDLMGLITFTSNVGMLLGAPICGFLIERAGWIGSALFVCLCSVFGSVCVMLIHVESGCQE